MIFSCPACHKTMKAADNLAGRQMRCFACKTPFVIPGSQSEASPAQQRSVEWQPMENVPTLRQAESPATVTTVAKRSILPIVLLSALGLSAVGGVGIFIFAAASNWTQTDSDGMAMDSQGRLTFTGRVESFGHVNEEFDRVLRNARQKRIDDPAYTNAIVLKVKLDRPRRVGTVTCCFPEDTRNTRKDWGIKEGSIVSIRGVPYIGDRKQQLEWLNDPAPGLPLHDCELLNR
jgi:hypothetical protein